jgi:hypothetical protein
MKPTKRYTDPLGRSALVSRYGLHALCLALVILGSAWPIWPRSIRATFDTAPPLAATSEAPHERSSSLASRSRRRSG